MRFALRAIEAVWKLTDLVTGGRLLWGPSLEVIAGKGRISLNIEFDKGNRFILIHIYDGFNCCFYFI